MVHGELDNWVVVDIPTLLALADLRTSGVAEVAELCVGEEGEVMTRPWHRLKPLSNLIWRVS